jgi:plasmid stability protein
MHDLIASRIMARTTIDLDPVILRELRRRGAREGKSMGQVASELLAQAVSTGADLSAPPFAWTSADLGVALVDLEDPEAVRRALNEPA